MDALLAVANVSDRGRQDCTLLKRSVNVDLTAHVVRFFWLVACTVDHGHQSAPSPHSCSLQTQLEVRASVVNAKTKLTLLNFVGVADGRKLTVLSSADAGALQANKASAATTAAAVSLYRPIPSLPRTTAACLARPSDGLHSDTCRWQTRQTWRSIQLGSRSSTCSCRMQPRRAAWQKWPADNDCVCVTRSRVKERFTCSGLASVLAWTHVDVWLGAACCVPRHPQRSN